MPAATSSPSASLGTGTGVGAGGEQRTAAGDVAGVLDPGGIARIEQQFGRDAQRLLGAGGHDDVGRIGQQPAGRGEMGGDLRAQFRADPAAAGSR